MRIFVLKAFFAFSLVLSSLPLSANPPLLEAMKAWESKEDKRAGILFAPLRKIPIARPYWNQLRREGIIQKLFEDNKLDKSCLEVDLLDGDIRALKEDRIAQEWFWASNIIRQNSGGMDIHEELERLNTPASLAHVIDFSGPSPQSLASLVHNGNKQIKILLSSRESEIRNCFLTGILNGYYDVQCFLHGEVKCEIPSLRLPDGQTDLFKRLLEKEPSVGNALFKFYQIQKMAPKFEGPNREYTVMFHEGLLKSAAYYGSIEAQKELNLRQNLYWTMQLANQGDASSLYVISQCFYRGDDLKQDRGKALMFSKLAVAANSQNDPSIYNDHALFLANLSESPVDPREVERFHLLAIQNGKDSLHRENFGIFLAQQGSMEEAKEYLLGPAQEGSLRSLNEYMGLCRDPNEYAPLLPTCLKKAEETDEAAFLFIKMIASSHKEVRGKYEKDLKGFWIRLKSRKKKTKEDYTRIGSCLLYFNPDHVLEGKALSFFEKGAKSGSPQSHLMTGKCYERGIGGAKSINTSKALAAYDKVIKTKNVPQDILYIAYVDIAKILMNGKDTRQYKKAFRYLHKAYKFQEASPYASYNLGIMYMEGKGTEIDLSKAEKYFLEVIDHDTFKIDAKYLLAIVKYKQRERKNFEQIYTLLSEGVANENPDTLALMAQTILYDPAKSDDKEAKKLAIHYLKKAIELNSVFAKPVYLFYGTVGIEGVLRKETDGKVIKRIFNNFSEKEKKNYLSLLDQVLPGMTELFSEEEEEVTAPLPEEAPQQLPGETDSEEEIGTCLLNDEEEPHPEREETGVDQKFQKLQEQVSKIMGKKKVKWTKLRSLIGQAIELSSGYVRQGKGSGTKIKVGDTKTGLHLPHGKDSTEIKGGRLKSVMDLLEGCLEESPSKKDLSKKRNNDPE